MLGTCTIDVHFVFPATTVELNSSRLVSVDGEFVKAVGEKLEKGLEGHDRTPSSTILPFGAQQVVIPTHTHPPAYPHLAVASNAPTHQPACLQHTNMHATIKTHALTPWVSVIPQRGQV